MKELRAIIAAADAAEANGERYALATLVKVQGSSYRRIGAKMLITESGRCTGAISGGCLESDVRRQAQFAMQTGRSLLSVYDTTDDDDTSPLFGVGCGGALFVLLEPSSLATLRTRLAQYRAFLCAPLPTALATVHSAEGQLKNEIGHVVICRENGDLFHTLCHPELAAAIARDALALLRQRRTAHRRYEIEHSAAEVLIEVLLLPVQLFIFGAGYDAVPLADFAKRLGWHISVLDSRPASLSRQHFAMADQLWHLTSSHDISRLITMPERTAAVVMTHNFRLDTELLSQLLPLPLLYLGVLGPKHRTEKLLAHLQTYGHQLTSEMLARLYAPTGLDIGAELPEEIALAIVAEIQAVLAKRSGTFLRNRTAPIHSDEMLESPPSNLKTQ